MALAPVSARPGAPPIRVLVHLCANRPKRRTMPQAVAEMQRRHDLPLIPADKTGKSDFIEVMVNREFIQGRIRLAPACAQLAEQYAPLVWDDRSGKREEHPGCRNDLADSALYAWRRTYQYLSVREPAPPVPGTPEWAAQEEEEMLQAALLQYRREHADPLDPWSDDPMLWDWTH